MALAVGDEIRFRYLGVVTRGTIVAIEGDASVWVEYTTRRTGTSRVRVSVDCIV